MFRMLKQRSLVGLVLALCVLGQGCASDGVPPIRGHSDGIYIRVTGPANADEVLKNVIVAETTKKELLKIFGQEECVLERNNDTIIIYRVTLQRRDTNSENFQIVSETFHSKEKLYIFNIEDGVVSNYFRMQTIFRNTKADEIPFSCFEREFLFGT